MFLGQQDAEGSSSDGVDSS